MDGIEVASGGELAHVREALPDARLAFGGPGKTDDELRQALALDVERIHVESPYELSRLAEIAQAAEREVDILLRLNLVSDRSGVALAMSGPFGMDPELIESCTDILTASPHVRLRGIHAHLASGLDASAMVAQSTEILTWGRAWLDRIGHTGPREFNLGGGMAVDYSTPGTRFDWKQYGTDVAALAEPGETLRIEPGRSISVYAGWYITEVLDVKKAHGQWYAVLRGGTMHIRTPVTKQHNHPFDILASSGDGPAAGEPVTLVGQLCTPKDVFAREVPTDRVAVGDLVAFSMSGAYAWNISHHDFLMHPKPTHHFLGH